MKYYQKKEKKERKKSKREGNVVENSYFENYCQCQYQVTNNDTYIAPSKNYIAKYITVY